MDDRERGLATAGRQLDSWGACRYDVDGDRVTSVDLELPPADADDLAGETIEVSIPDRGAVSVVLSSVRTGPHPVSGRRGAAGLNCESSATDD